MTPAEKQKFLDSPALQPPAGTRPNLHNPSSLHVLGPGILQLSLVTLFVAMRLYAKVRVVKKVRAEDYALLLAWAFVAGSFYPILFLLNDLPMGVHQWNMTMRQLIKHDRLYSLLKYAYAAVIIPLKVSIILQILRLFAPLGRATNTSIFWLAHLFLWVNIILYGSNFVVQITSCRPIARGWDPTIDGSCTKRRYTHVFTASLNTASDVVLLLLPLPGIWKLKVHDWRTKWMLRAVFLFGICACIATVIRLYYSAALQHSADLTYTAALVTRWAEAELTCGFLVACLPYLPNLMKHVRNSLQGPRSSGGPETWAGRQCENLDVLGGKDELLIAQTGRGDSPGGKPANNIASGRESMV